jgi:hypothetical protein
MRPPGRRQLARLCDGIRDGLSVASAARSAGLDPDRAYGATGPAGVAIRAAISERNRAWGLQWCTEVGAMTAGAVNPPARRKRRRRSA